MIQGKEKNQCCGCMACLEICPVSCIQEKTDEYGFSYPLVNTKSCIQCGKCEEVCPMRTPELREGKAYYMGYALDPCTRKEGSSGGIFGAAAKAVLQKQGVVFGAGFTEELELVLMKAETLSELGPLYKSKYIQCRNTVVTFRTIGKELKRGRTVLFCSTPCNCMALDRYLGKTYDNLIRIDFVCHGVGSPKLFAESLEWRKQREGLVTGFDFRSKNHSINCSRVFERTTNGIPKQDIYLSDPYYYYYCDYISMRESCYECPYATDNRCSDITIGDCCLPETYFPGEERLAGFSSVICSTKKGVSLVEELPLHKISVEKAAVVNTNHCLQRPTVSKRHTEFMEDYLKVSFDELLRKYGYDSVKTKIKRAYYKMPGWMQEILRKVLIGG